MPLITHGPIFKGEVDCGTQLFKIVAVCNKKVLLLTNNVVSKK